MLCYGRAGLIWPQVQRKKGRLLPFSYGVEFAQFSLRWSSTPSGDGWSPSNQEAGAGSRGGPPWSNYVTRADGGDPRPPPP